MSKDTSGKLNDAAVPSHFNTSKLNAPRAAEEWMTVPLSSLCTIKNGKSDTQDATDDGLYAFFDRSKVIKKSRRYLFDCEALIIPGEGTEFIPRHFIGKFDLHQRAYALYNFSKEINARFLFGTVLDNYLSKVEV